MEKPNLEDSKETQQDAVRDDLENKEDHNEWFNKLDEAAQKEILKLRKENAKWRSKSKELDDWKNKADEYDKILQKQKEDQGKWQELYEVEKGKVSEYENLKNEISGYENYFKAEIEKENESLDDVHKEIIEKMNVSLSEKLAYIQKLKGQNPAVKTGHNERPGAAPAININLDDYIGVEGRKKLFEIKKKDSKLFQMILNQMKSKK